MNIPYNTGKVEIGKYYQKPYYVEEDDDMLAIQGWLLGDNRRARQRYWANVVYTFFLIVMIVIMVISYD
jgi:hypothetical protein